MLARVWSLFVGMLGGAAIVGVLLVGHALFFDDGSNGIAATDTASVPTSDPAATLTATSQPDTLGALGNDTPIDPNVNPLPPPPSGTVTLLDVFTDSGTTVATVMVDADSYNVAAGDTFATNYRVDAINGRCAQLRHGSNAFELCVGASRQT